MSAETHVTVVAPITSKQNSKIPSILQTINTTKEQTTTTVNAALPETTLSYVSNKIIILYQKSKISNAVQEALSTIASGHVHIYNSKIDGPKFDVQSFVDSSYTVLILWAGQSVSEAGACHNWIIANKNAMKSSGITFFLVPSQWFSRLGIKSVYADLGVVIKSVPKYAPKLGKTLDRLLLEFEEEFPPSEVSLIKGIGLKVWSLLKKSLLSK